MTLTKTDIYSRSFVLFFLYFLWSGTLSVVHQLFFLNNYPQHKNSFLGIVLVLGTIAAIFGLRRSHKVVNFNRARFVILIFLIITTISLSSMFIVKNLIAYFLVFCVLMYVSNFIYNYLDQYFVRTAPAPLLKVQVRANITYQLLGIMIAPFYFSFLYHMFFINIGALCTLGFLSTWLASRKSNLMSIPELTHKEGDSKYNSLTTLDWLFIVYAGGTITGIVIFSSILMYVLKDYYLLAEAKTFGGIFIGIISIVAIISVQIHSMLRKTAPVADTAGLELKMFSPYLSFITLGLFLSTSFLMSLKLSTSIVYLILISCVVGCAYGLFLSVTRQYASSISIASCKPKLLSTYNNLGNYGSLTGFSVLLPISLVSAKMEMNFCLTMIHVVTGFFFIAFCYCLLYLFKSGSRKI